MVTINSVGAAGVVVGEIIISYICLRSQPGFGYSNNIHPIRIGFYFRPLVRWAASIEVKDTRCRVRVVALRLVGVTSGLGG